MTNAEIILRTSEQLVEQGILGVVEVGGEMVPEPIHTFNGWKALGYSVKKGEKSAIKFPIWKYSSKMVERKTKDGGTDEVESSSMFQKVSAFFTFAQVEPIKQN